ncbi:hypothetical protein RBSWK_00005 [Rhodopirellula baltica SWK14]|uniref:Uncharacterized protein n=1 Tax=Rhodopirellula baltica SWK14 TaxID=993516 RepID=L7CS99_RHOBT|nr:hypothetical protein RBSWK_00005 [Rhodopirellula baltica SWK14]
MSGLFTALARVVSPLILARKSRFYFCEAIENPIAADCCGVSQQVLQNATPYNRNSWRVTSRLKRFFRGNCSFQK